MYPTKTGVIGVKVDRQYLNGGLRGFRQTDMERHYLDRGYGG